MERYSDGSDFDPLDTAAMDAYVQSSKTAPPARKRETADERRARQAAKKRSEAGTIARRTQMRRQWENSPDGADRMRAVNADNPDVPVGLHYQVRSWGSSGSLTPGAGVFGKDDPVHAGRGWEDRQLPGLENPHAAPQQPRWEELPEKEQQRALRKAKMFGVDPDFMERAFGAQLDQAYTRAERNTPPGTAVVPHGRDHYYTGDQAGKMRETAKELGIPFGVHVAMSAFTSPNTKFRQGDAYPNDEAAANVVRQMQAGADPRDVTNRIEGEQFKRAQGYETNMRKAADVFDQVQNRGIPLPEAVVRYNTRTGEEKAEPTNPFGPKTAPYHNSYLPDTPDFLVSDVHTGGGGFLPHLSYEKPVRKDARGNPVLKGEYRSLPEDHPDIPRNADGSVSEKAYDRVKSEREVAIERIPHFHAMADHAARRAMSARGLTKVPEAQASQWYEEQIRRTAAYPKLGLLTEEKAYPKPAPKPEDPRQGRMF